METGALPRSLCARENLEHPSSRRIYKQALAQVRSTQGNPENPNEEVRAGGVSVFGTNPNQIKARSCCLSDLVPHLASSLHRRCKRHSSFGTLLWLSWDRRASTCSDTNSSRTCSRARISGPSRPAVAKLQEPPDGFPGPSGRSHRRHQEATRLRPGGGQLRAAGALTPGVSQSGGFSLLRAWARRQGQVPRPPDPQTSCDRRRRRQARPEAMNSRIGVPGAPSPSAAAQPQPWRSCL